MYLKEREQMQHEQTPPEGRVTLRDIARDTGFSVNTVSHALKGKEDISEKTRELIRRRAQELGYIADSIAGSLRSGSTRTIAVILGDVSNPHFGLWVREIEAAVFRHGYSTLIINTDEDEQVEQGAVVAAISKRVDGIIICPTQKQTACVDTLRRSGIPFVLIGRRWEDMDTDYVVADDVQGGYIATRNLMERGAEKVLFLNGPGHISSSCERLQGYLNAHEEAGFPVDQARIRTVGIKSGECGRVLREAIAEGAAFNSILAFSDIVAFEALNELRRLGGQYARMPLVSFDDSMQGLVLPIALDSIDSDEGSPAVAAADLLLQRIAERRRHEASPPRQIVLKVRMIHRNFFE
jgi:LacI family transcriptional regulator